MCVYCKAASAVLDTLWDDQDFRGFFYQRGFDLGSLGAIMHDVFVPAYLTTKQALKGGALEMLEAQVTQDILGPLYDRPSFRELWEAWDQTTREAFLREQSEMKLGKLLVRTHQRPLAEAYKRAFQAYLK